MKKKLVFMFFLIISTIYVYSKIEYRIQGKVVFNGVGVGNALISVYPVEIAGSKKNYWHEIKTDSSGSFFFYAVNGSYELSIIGVEGKDDLIAKKDKIDIKIDSKNIVNIIIELEKGCVIKGVVKYPDNSPIEDCDITVSNHGDIRSGNTKNGVFEINKIRHDAVDITNIDFEIPGYCGDHISQKVMLADAGVSETIQVVLPQKLIAIKGIVVDKDTKQAIENYGVVIAIEYANKNYASINCRADMNAKNEFFFYNLKSGTYWLACASIGDSFNVYKEKDIQIIYDGKTTLNLTIELEKN